jgi:carboxymethylenebutenolidase
MVKYGAGISAVRALPKAKGKRPAVIILHERYGIDQHTKDLTVKLAQAGFVGLAPDLFHRFTGDRKAVLRGEQRVDLSDEGALEDLNGAVEYLKKLKEVDGARIGIIGEMTSRARWCFTALSAAGSGRATSSARRRSKS